MHKLALVGKNIQHSRSQEIYERILNQPVDYTLLDYQSSAEIVAASKLLELFEGVSITAPYKTHFLNQIDELQSPINVVNCLKKENGKIIGTNTDYLACKEILQNYVNNDFSKIVLLGDGSMADVVKNILEKMKLDFDQLSRKLNNLTKDKIDDLSSDKTLIINTCARQFTFPGELKASILFWDMNYNLEHHARAFAEAPAQYVDGIELLELQAKYALSFWNLNKY